jgi:hypothetical protein
VNRRANQQDEAHELPRLQPCADREPQQRQHHRDEDDVERIVERQRRPQSEAAGSRSAVQDAQVVLAGARERGRHEQRAPRPEQHAERDPAVVAEPLEDQVHRRDDQAGQHCPVQIRPERHERDEQPDAP